MTGKERNRAILFYEWLRRADEDLGTAQLLLDQKKYPSAALFHSQQAVEKLLKGLLILEGFDIKDEFKTHSLPRLFNELQKTKLELSAEFKDICKRLTKYYEMRTGVKDAHKAREEVLEKSGLEVK